MVIENNVLYDVNESDLINGTFTIPEGVTAIGDRAFFQCTALKKVIFPESLKRIGKFAFTNCVNLSEIQLPESLQSIDDSAFSSCTALTDVKLPNSIKNLGAGAFASCYALESINIPEKVTEISMHLFSRCTSLKHIDIPKNVQTIGNHSFFKCDSLSNINIPENIIKIDDYAFSDCKYLEKVTLPNSLKILGENAFSECKNLKNINIPSSVSNLSNRVFYNCNNLSNIIVPNGIKSIGESAFAGCALSSIKIPNSVSKLGSYVFNNCSELESVYLSKNLTTIPEFAFEGCYKLKSLGCSNEYKFDNLTGENLSPDNFIEGSVIIPDTIKIIEKSAFSRCESMKKVILPTTLEELGEYAFKNCVSLKEAYLPESLDYLKDYTFNNCLSLSYITLPENLTYVGKNTFENCQRLRYINIPESVKSIDDSAFSKCINLTSINLPDNITEIPAHCFNTCLSLSDIKLPKNLEKIGEYAFSKTDISKIELPESVIDAGDYTFWDCPNLETVKLPSNLPSIKKGVFQKCPSLCEIDIPKSVKSIGNYAFSNNPNLSKINLHDGLNTISYGAFYQCPSLYTIDIPETVNTINDNAFDSCPNLTTIYIPENVKKLGTIRNDFNFFEKCDKGFILSSNQTEKSIPTNSIKIDLPLISRHWEHRNTLFKEQNNPNICFFYNTYLAKQPESRINEFLNNHNFTFFKQLSIPNVPEKRYEMYNMLYNLGAMSTPIEVNGKKVDYAQKVVGLILEKIRKQEITLSALRDIFIYMNDDGFKPEFTKFFLENFNELLNEEGLSHGFISRCYNEFEEVQRTNTSNRGSQRQLKPTISKFSYYFMDNKFAGVDESNRHIADVLSPYFHEQRIFDQALKIEAERKQKNSPDHILNIPLIEKSPFEQIDELTSLIVKEQGETLKNLLETSASQFSYEWLAKNDPQNLILGKLCSCCSHIEGGGYGIMHASIVDPYVQNLVIRNSQGRIIAKSTLYINPIERYGVFNNVEVNEDLSTDDKKEIYEKFIKGAKEFAEEYNREFPDKPLKQINVGMNLNDLTAELHRHSRESKKLLKAIDYSIYGIPNQLYSGDSELEQFVVWENENLSQKKQSDNFSIEKS